MWAGDSAVKAPLKDSTARRLRLSVGIVLDGRKVKSLFGFLTNNDKQVRGDAHAIQRFCQGRGQ